MRELANLVERLSIIHPGGVIGVSELPAKFRHIEEPDPGRYQAPQPPPQGTANGAPARSEVGDSLPADGIDLKSFLESHERRLIHQALEASGQVVSKAARLLHVRRTTLVEKMRKYGIERQ